MIDASPPSVLPMIFFLTFVDAWMSKDICSFLSRRNALHHYSVSSAAVFARARHLDVEIHYNFAAQLDNSEAWHFRLNCVISKEKNSFLILRLYYRCMIRGTPLALQSVHPFVCYLIVGRVRKSLGRLVSGQSVWLSIPRSVGQLVGKLHYLLDYFRTTRPTDRSTNVRSLQSRVAND